MGADAVAGPDDGPVAAFGEQPRVVMVTAPEPAAMTLAVVALGGGIHAFGGIPGGAQVDVNAVHCRHLTLLGSTGSGTRDLVAARDLVLDDRVPLDRLPVEVVGLDAAPAALQRRPASPALKTLVRTSPEDV